MKKITIVLYLLLAFVYPLNALAEAQNFKFGILRIKPDGDYEMDTETRQIPMRLKETGFRFGISFDNPQGSEIKWYEVVRLPKAPAQVSGGLQKAASNVLKSPMQKGNDTHIVDQFWFDRGDPPGAHSLEVYVNGKKKFTVDFNVVE